MNPNARITKHRIASLDRNGPRIFRVRHHQGYGHGLAPGTSRDLNCLSCRREDGIGQPALAGDLRGWAR